MNGAGSLQPGGVRLCVFMGTKAQFLKMVPILLAAQERGLEVHVIDTGQHGSLIRSITDEHGLSVPGRSLVPGSEGVSTILGGLAWLGRISRLLVEGRDSLSRRLFGGEKTVCLVHGDTLSTLVSALIAKRAGQQVAHVEAGLRSYRLWDPFPEEIVRILVMRLSDLLFAPNPEAMRNIEKMGLSASAYLLSGNTGIDALRLALARGSALPSDLPAEYGIATVHRLETLYDQARLRRVVDFVIRAQERLPILWVQHPPTARRLRRHGLERTLLKAGVRCVDLQPHSVFVQLLKRAAFVLTDGGSIQEEVAQLGVPALLLRNGSERPDGLGNNVVLSEMQEQRLVSFLDDFESFRRPARATEESPSREIIDILCSQTGA